MLEAKVVLHKPDPDFVWASDECSGARLPLAFASRICDKYKNSCAGSYVGVAASVDKLKTLVDFGYTFVTV